MSPPGVVCEYCAHRDTSGGSHCGHCGGPLRAVAAAAETVLTQAPPVLKGAHEVVQRAGKALETELTAAQRSLLIVACVLALVAIAVLACVYIPRVRAPAPPLSAGRALPELLGTATACVPVDAAGRTERCVLPAGSPLLFGGLAGGRELTMYVELADPARLADAVRRWRGEGAVLLDGAVFAAVGPSNTVRYADPGSGLRLETSAFTGTVAARTFLGRSGLIAP